MCSPHRAWCRQWRFTASRQLFIRHAADTLTLDTSANRTISNRPNSLGTALAYQLRIGRTVSLVRGRSSMMQQVAVFSMAVDPRVSEELKHHWRRFVVLGAAEAQEAHLTRATGASSSTSPTETPTRSSSR